MDTTFIFDCDFLGGGVNTESFFGVPIGIRRHFLGIAADVRIFLGVVGTHSACLALMPLARGLGSRENAMGNASRPQSALLRAPRAIFLWALYYYYYYYWGFCVNY